MRRSQDCWDIVLWHGIACLVFPTFCPIYFYSKHPSSGWKPFINMMLGLGLTWVAIPMFRQADAKPARPTPAGGDPLEGIGPSRSDPDSPAAEQLTATTGVLAELLAGVTDEASARKVAPRFRQLMAQLRKGFPSIG